MSSAFYSWADFLRMGGYAVYIWLSVTTTLLVIGGVLFHTWCQRRQILREIVWRQSRATEGETDESTS